MIIHAYRPYTRHVRTRPAMHMHIYKMCTNLAITARGGARSAAAAFLAADLLGHRREKLQRRKWINKCIIYSRPSSSRARTAAVPRTPTGELRGPKGATNRSAANRSQSAIYVLPSAILRRKMNKHTPSRRGKTFAKH